MGFVYKFSFMNSKSLVSFVSSETIKFAKIFSFAPPPPPPRTLPQVMYIAPSNDQSLLTLNLPFKVILWRFEGF